MVSIISYFLPSGSPKLITADHQTRTLADHPTEIFSTIPRHQGRVTQKMRLRHIVGEGQGVALSWVDSLVNFVSESNNILSAEVHNHEDQPRFTTDAVVGRLMSVGGLVKVIVSYRSS
jgi:hypothetical protein